MAQVFKNKKLRIFLYVFLFIFLIACVICLNIPFVKLNDFYKNSYATQKEINQLKDSNYFGPFIGVEINEKDKMVSLNSSATEEDYTPEIKFKLFNLIPIKTQKIKLIKDDKVMVGGNAVGIVLKMKGILIVGSSPIIDSDGKTIDALEKSNLKIGDILTEIEGESIESISSISKIINKEENLNKDLTVKGIRNNVEFETTVKPIFDEKSKLYKLGVWVRDDASGIGTITYINSNNRFGALGHPICDNETKSIISLSEGELFNCSILGVNKGVSGMPGELKGLFMQGKNEQGLIEKNNEYGIFGTIKNDSNLLKDFETVEVGSRLSAKPGKAKIRCCLDGNKVEEFDIEIIKTNYQNYFNSKSMVLRVTDKSLIERTGGIVQGMSGSPILQNGKIIGAVTHVFLSDPTKGFGVYIDWMLEQ